MPVYNYYSPSKCYLFNNVDLFAQLITLKTRMMKILNFNRILADSVQKFKFLSISVCLLIKMESEFDFFFV